MLHNEGSTLPSPIQILNPNTLYNPKPFGYSHVAMVQHFQKILHISGQGGENTQGVLSQHFEQQVRQAFMNLQLALQVADASLANIAMLRILMTDYSPQKHQLLIQQMQLLWQHSDFPACTLIPVPCLALAGMQIEIEATAYCP